MLTRSTTGRSVRQARRRIVAVALCSTVIGAFLLGFGRGSAGAQQAGPAFQIVVHPKNPESSVSREFLSDVFLKKTTRWEHGEGLRPVDLKPNSGTRQKFSETVLKRSVAAVRSYWQQRIFARRS
jgi:ABC-type phosphate transport system substrate-binding protein